MTAKRKLLPVLEGEPWMIGPNPTDLGPLQGDLAAVAPKRPQEVVDHHVWRDAEGNWRLWACVRGTAVGRILYGWKSPSLEQPDWEPTGVAMRRDGSLGENCGKSGPDASATEEWIQSPYVIRSDDGLYHMFYGGSWADPCGTVRICSICHATSRDGIVFDRTLDSRGKSVVFQGPGEARDPCLIRIGGLWHLYYSGDDYTTDPTVNHGAINKMFVRTSSDLVAWSGSREVQWGGRAGIQPWRSECPHVVERGGQFFMFRTANYGAGETYVYRSEDPFDFGLGDDSHLVGMLDVAAPEIVVDGDREYVTSNKDLRGGCRLQRLAWVEE